MATQKEIFEAGEGNQWFYRNKKSSLFLAENDGKIIDLIQSLEVSFQKVLEIGCSNGHLIEKIRRNFDVDCYGIDPSSEAIEDGINRFPKISLQTGTADRLLFDSQSFDMIIFGFCLYLCDRKDLFKIAYEADRCLKNEGTLIIKDFYPSFPYKNRYSHHEKIFSYKMDYSLMFKWNPAYAEVLKSVFSHRGSVTTDAPDEKVAIIILRKNEQYAYPEQPFHFEDPS